jgi:hypothetical protein
MRRFAHIHLPVAVFFLVLGVTGATAHSDRPQESAEQPVASPYAVEEIEEPSLEPDGLPFSRSPLLDDEGPMTGEMQGMNHGDHTMPEVKLAEHSLVSRSQKGYGLAAAVTVFSGLIFGFLWFKRPNE